MKSTQNKKYMVVMTAVVVVVLVLLGVVGCAAPTPAPSPAPAPAPKPAQDTPAKVYKLKFAGYQAPGASGSVTMDKFAERVKEVTKGQILVECFHSGSLIKSAALLGGVRDGLADFIHTNLAYTAGQLPLSEWAGNVPYYITFDKLDKAYPEVWKMVDDEAKQKGMPIRSVWSACGQNEWYFVKPQNADKPDWTGLKVRTAGEPWTTIITKLGGSAIMGSSAETGLMASTGLINASCGALTSYDSTDLYKVMPNIWIVGGWHNATNIFLMNTKMFDGLPKDLQVSLQSVFPEMWAFIKEKENSETVEVLRKAKEKGSTVTMFTDAQRKTLRDMIRPWHDPFIEDLEKKGYPAKKWMAWYESWVK